MPSSFDPAQLVVVIMAGGSGTRFWPLSTEQLPKQFIRLFGDRTMLQLTWDRIAGLVPPERVLVLTNARFAATVASQLPRLPAANIIGEPMPRDTSGAIGLAAALCRGRHEDPVMAVLTADHRIQPVALFHSTLLSAARAAAASDALITFGIEPTFPATGYGYLEAGDLLADDDGVEHYPLLRFCEKPDLETARGFVDTGRFCWNSGMFVWRTSSIWRELQTHLPRHAAAIAPLAEADGTDRWAQALHDAFQPLPKISIDFGVMEKAATVRMVRARFEWSDVGGWLALEQFHEADGDGNRSRGQLEPLDAQRNFVFCEDDRETVALVGVEDLVVVRAGDRTLVTHRDRAEEVKGIVERMKKAPGS